MPPRILTLGLLSVGLSIAAATSAAPLRVAAGPERVPLPERSTYERYVTLDDLLDAAPDSARALAARWRAERPGEVIAAWAFTWGTLRRDSLATAAALARAERDTADADAVAIGATLRLARRQLEPARRDFERLARLHAASGEWAAAAWAHLLRLLRDVAAADAAPDAAAATRFVARAPSARERDEVALLLADRAGPRSPVAHIAALRAALAVSPAASSAARGEAWRRLAAALRADGQHASADSAYRRAAALADSCGWKRLSMRAWRGVASIARARGRVADNVAMTRAFADSARAYGFDEQYSEALQDLGNSFLSMGRLREARAALEERLELIRINRWHYDQRIMTLDQLGGVAALEGRLDVAREHFEESLQLCQRRAGHEYEPTLRLHLGNLHRDQGDDAQALEQLELGLAAARAVGSRRTESMMLALKADILSDLGRADEAASLAADAAAHARAHEPRTLPVAWRTQSHALLAAGHVAAARAPLDSLRAFLAAAPDSLQQSRLERSEAEVALAAGDTARALHQAALAVALARGVGSPDEIADASLTHAMALQYVGQPAASIPLIETGIAYAEGLLASTASSDERSRTRRRYQANFADLARGYHAAGRTSEAFALLDRSRARELREQFGEGAAGAAAHLPPSIAGEWRRTEEDLASLQRLLLEEWARPARARDRELPRWEARADSLKRSLEDLHVRMQRAAPEFARAAGLAAPLGLADAQRQLGEGEILVAFMLGTARSLRFDVTSRECRVHELPWDGEAMAVRARAWVAALQRGSDDGWRRGAAALADTLLAGLELPARAGATLLIVPDGALHTMPFEALLVPMGGQRVPLLQRAAIVTAEAPGLFFVPPLPARAGGEGGIAAFGDPLLAASGASPSRERATTLAPLPHARHEVERLRDAFPGARLYLGAAATEPQLHAELERARIVHVAAHGFYDDRYPRFSSLALAQGDSSGEAASDGLLQAWEVLEQRGQLELVTLSACETGRGRVVGGEGLDGLSRAFRIAGARQLIASLWRVDDAATATLMGDFYARLARGTRVAEAFREARLALARGGGTSGGGSRGVGRTTERSVAAHPRVWAAFVLRGAR